MGWLATADDLDGAGARYRSGDARLELASRYLHVFGPATAEAFAEWAAIAPSARSSRVRSLAGSLTPVQTPIGDTWILAADEEAFRTSSSQ